MCYLPAGTDAQINLKDKVQSSKEERKDGGKEEKNRAEVRNASCLKTKIRRKLKTERERVCVSKCVSEWKEHRRKKLDLAN